MTSSYFSFSYAPFLAVRNRLRNSWIKEREIARLWKLTLLLKRQCCGSEIFWYGIRIRILLFSSVANKKPTKNKFFLKDLLLITLQEIKVFLTFLLFDGRIGIRYKYWRIRIRETQKHTDPVPDPKRWLKGQCHEIFYSRFSCGSPERSDTGGMFNAVHLKLRKFQQI